MSILKQYRIKEANGRHYPQKRIGLFRWEFIRPFAPEYSQPIPLFICSRDYLDGASFEAYKEAKKFLEYTEENIERYRSYMDNKRRRISEGL